MKVRVREHLILICALTVGTVLVAGVAWALFRPRPTLDGVAMLLRVGNLEKAQQRLRAYLREYPRDSHARLLIVDCQLQRYERLKQPDPALLRDALADARQIRLGSDPEWNALVELQRGKVFDRLSQYDEAEEAWLEALRWDPRVPEAGWQLLQLYDWQGRLDEARALALSQHARESDPRDRVGWLLELVRQDVQRPASRGLINWLEPIVKDHPQELRPNLTLGVALTREGLAEQGLARLQDAVKTHPQNADAWLALLTGLEEAGRADLLSSALDKLPAELATDPRYIKFRGEVAQERRDWNAAAASYRRVLEFRPHDLSSLYRLARVLRLSGQTEDADRYDQQAVSCADARKELRALYTNEIESVERSLAPETRPDLYRRIAELRERMGLRDEAAAWARLIADPHPDTARTERAP